MKPASLLLLIACLLSFQGVTAAENNGVRLLQAELPAKINLLNADADQLAAAVGKATLTHQSDAPAILRAALTRGVKPRRGEKMLSCAGAKRIFGVSVAAAPTQASALLDLATELFPDYSTDLAAVMRDYDRVAYDYKNVVDDKTVVDDKNGPARDKSGNPGDPNFARRTSGDPSNPNDPANAFDGPGDLSGRDLNGLGYSDSYSFGSAFSGFGPGFPGSPGFVGSTPSGGIALPPTAVTSVVNS